MKTLNTKLLLLLFIFIPCFSSAQTKSEGPWWPNKQWGAGDQSGGSNWITPEKIIKAMALVKKGKTLELGNIYERGMPLIGQRSYNIFIPAFPTSGPFGEDKVIYNDEFVAAEIGQVGTQFDGLGHPGRIMTMADGTTKEVFYNGFTADEMKSPYGLLNLGIENIKPIITRGILIDLAGYKNVKTLPEKYEITLSDVKNTLAKQGIKETDLEPGDALLFNLGWWRIWPDKKSVDGSPAYISREVVDWIISKKVCMVGSDASLDGPGSYVHTKLIMENGIFNLEFMNFKATENEKVYTFLFLFTPLRLKGATGSPGRPLAIY